MPEVAIPSVNKANVGNRCFDLMSFLPKGLPIINIGLWLDIISVCSNSLIRMITHCFQLLGHNSCMSQ